MVTGKVIPVVALGLLFLAFGSVNALASTDCDADVFLFSSEDDGDGHLALKFSIVVSDCSSCKGIFDYTLVLVDGDGVERRWERRGDWPVSDATETIFTPEYVNVASDETLEDVVQIKLHQCTCIAE